MAKQKNITENGGNKLLSRLMAATTIKETAVFNDSPFFKDRSLTQTDVPILNVAFSGRIDGGFGSGITIIAGPSKNFKSNLGLIAVRSYLKKYPDAVCLFYDNEYGSVPAYFDSLGVDTSRVIHCPIIHVEQLKFDIVAQLDAITKGDRVIIFVDSIGMLASKKEVEDAQNEKSVADMTRARALKGLFRIITSQLVVKEIPAFFIAHVYSSMELFSKPIVSGGCLVAGTEIIMYDGSTKKIEDISVGDLVITKEGIKPVTDTWNPETLENGTPECYEIEFEDGHTIICSDRHQFLVDGNWVEAKKLKEMDDCEVKS